MVGFCSVIHFPHPKNKKLKFVHRIVVLPDYQGIGIAKFMLNNIGKLYKDNGWDLRLKTSSFAMKKALEHNEQWIGVGVGVKNPNSGLKTLNKTLSNRRITFSFKYK